MALSQEELEQLLKVSGGESLVWFKDQWWRSTAKSSLSA
jgi:hypothetical protein